MGSRVILALLGLAAILAQPCASLRTTGQRRGALAPLGGRPHARRRATALHAPFPARAYSSRAVVLFAPDDDDDAEAVATTAGGGGDGESDDAVDRALCGVWRGVKRVAPAVVTGAWRADAGDENAAGALYNLAFVRLPVIAAGACYMKIVLLDGVGFEVRRRGGRTAVVAGCRRQMGVVFCRWRRRCSRRH